MRLRNFLNEERRSKKIKKEEFFELLKTKCDKALNGSSIYRRLDSDYDDGNSTYMYVDSTKSERTSAYTINYYTLLMDHILPSWKGWPKRSRSIMCATKGNEHLQVQDKEGYIYRVFPFDNAKIGLCSKYDIWESFLMLKKFFDSYDIPNINFFILGLEKVFQKLIGLSKESASPDSQSFKGYLEDLTNFIHKTDIDPSVIRKELLKGDTFAIAVFVSIHYHLSQDKSQTMIQYLDNLMNPKKNGFKIIESGDKIPNNRELWIEGESLLIKKKIADKYFKDI